jgi:hypothetical protein
LLARGWRAVLVFLDAGVPYERFRQLYYYSPWPDRKVEPSGFKRTTPFPERLARTPTSQLSYWLSQKPVCPDMKMTGSIPLPGPDPNTHFTWILPTNVPGYVPSRSDENLLAVVEARVLIAPPMQPEIQWAFWHDVDIFVRREQHIHRDEWVQPWLEHFNDSMHRKRYTRALKTIESEGVGCIKAALKTTKVMVKCDELLTKTEDLAGQIHAVMKPRLIANVNEIPQAWVGPEIFAATMNLKKQWPVEPDPWHVNGTEVYITYGCGLSDVELTRWLRFALIPKKNAWHIIVAGDDSLVLVWDNYKLTVHEGDAAMYDQSQSKGPLEFESRVLYVLGVSGSVRDVLHDLTYADYVAYSRDFSSKNKVTVSRKLRPIRDTGGSNTSSGNSCVMAHALIHALKQDRTNIIPGMARLGLSMKVKTFSSIDQATFLKGMWYRTVDSDYFWGPLPSRILKVGKCIKDPKDLYSAHTKDFKEACKLFLNDVACGYDFFMEVPLIRVFIKNFKMRDQILDLQEQYHTLAEKCLKPKPHFDIWEQLCLRYGLTQQEFLEAEALYPSDPFHFIEHPVYHVLNQVDYN